MLLFIKLEKLKDNLVMSYNFSTMLFYISLKYFYTTPLVFFILILSLGLRVFRFYIL